MLIKHGGVASWFLWYTREREDDEELEHVDPQLTLPIITGSELIAHPLLG